MKIQIESNAEALEFAEALRVWIEGTLAAVGFTKPVMNEGPYYTQRRDLAERLKAFARKA